MEDIGGRLAKGGKGAGIGVGMLGAVGAVAAALYQSVYTVEGGHRAVMFNRISGVQKDIYKEGIHFRVPWFQYPIIYDIRARPRKIVSPTGSKDLQMVNIGLRVLARPDQSELPSIYRQLGVDYDERVLPSIINEVLKGVVAKFNASQLITQRQQVSLLIRRDLVNRAKDFNIILDDVSITDLSFGREYTAAVEAKQVAQQEAQRAHFFVEKARQEKQQKVVQAEGEAEAAKMIGQAIKENPGYLKLRKIRAAQQIAKTLTNSQNKVYLNASTLMLNINEKEFDQTVDNMKRKKEVSHAIPLFVEGKSDFRLMCVMLELLNETNRLDSQTIARVDVQEKGGGASRGILAYSFGGVLHTIKVIECGGSSRLLRNVCYSLVNKVAYLAIVDGDAVIPGLSRAKLKQFGVKGKPRHVYQSLTQVRPNWKDTRLSQLVNGDGGFISNKLAPTEVLSGILRTYQISPDYLHIRLHCDTFTDVLQFYEQCLNIFSWKENQMTLEDMFTDSTMSRKRIKKIFLRSSDQYIRSFLLDHLSVPKTQLEARRLKAFLHTTLSKYQLTHFTSGE